MSRQSVADEKKAFRHRMSGRERARRPIVFGLRDSIPESPFLNSREVSRLSGGNAGNFAFTAAIRRQLVGWGDPVSLGWRATPKQLRAAGEICVIPGANKLGTHADMGKIAERIEDADMPTVVISLGAQSSIDYRIPKLPAGTLRWLRAIVDRAPMDYDNVGVRGQFTRRVLAEYGFAKVRVLGCPSLFLNPSARLGRLLERNAAEPPRHIAVAAGGPKWRHLARIEQSLTRMVTATNGAYICQRPFVMTAMARGEFDGLSPTELERCRVYVDRDMSMPDFLLWMRHHAVVFYDALAWMEFLRGFDFVVGTRIHGVMLGIQVGVPGLCIVSDSRTRELCETMDVPHVFARDYLRGLGRDQLYGLFQERFDASRFDANRRRLAASYCTFLHANRLTASAELETLAEGANS